MCVCVHSLGDVCLDSTHVDDPIKSTLIFFFWLKTKISYLDASQLFPMEPRHMGGQTITFSCWVKKK